MAVLTEARVFAPILRLHRPSAELSQPLDLAPSEVLTEERVAALLCSLIESARVTAEEPRVNLGGVPQRAIRTQGTVTLDRDLE